MVFNYYKDEIYKKTATTTFFFCGNKKVVVAGMITKRLNGFIFSLFPFLLLKNVYL